VSHTYASDGTYTINLTVTDKYGKSDSYSVAITVSSGGTTGGPTGGSSGSATGTIFEIILTKSGSSIWISTKDKVKVKFNETWYELKLTRLSATTATIYVYSGETAVFNIGDKLEFDLDEDGEKDMSIKLNEIASSKARITLKLVVEEVPVIIPDICSIW